MDKKVYLTPAGLADLKTEYNDLINKKRPEVLESLSQARNQGDLSENAEYVSAKEELAFVDSRIDELEEMFKNVELIDEKASANDKNEVVLGSKFTLEVKNEKTDFSLVGELEANPEENKISDKSPLGKAVLGKKVGETAVVKAPAGDITYKVVSIN